MLLLVILQLWFADGSVPLSEVIAEHKKRQNEEPVKTPIKSLYKVTLIDYPILCKSLRKDIESKANYEDKVNFKLSFTASKEHTPAIKVEGGVETEKQRLQEKFNQIFETELEKCPENNPDVFRMIIPENCGISKKDVKGVLFNHLDGYNDSEIIEWGKEFLVQGLDEEKSTEAINLIKEELRRISEEKTALERKHSEKETAHAFAISSTVNNRKGIAQMLEANLSNKAAKNTAQVKTHGTTSNAADQMQSTHAKAEAQITSEKISSELKQETSAESPDETAETKSDNESEKSSKSLEIFVYVLPLFLLIISALAVFFFLILN